MLSSQTQRGLYGDGHTGRLPLQAEPDDYLEIYANSPLTPRRITQEKLMEDLYITPSGSDSTICQDEYLKETTPSTTQNSGSIYRIFK